MDKLSDWFKSWKLVSWRSAVVAAIVIYGLVGFFVVPVVVKKIIVKVADERVGRKVTVGDVSCNPFALSLTVRDFSMPDRPGSTFVSFDEFYANAQISSLFRWAATLKELRVVNPYVGVRRFPDGGVNVLELKEDIEARMPPDDDPEEKGGLPRVLLQHILVTGSAIDVEDYAREEPLEWKFGPAEFELHDISTIPEREGVDELLIGLERGGEIGTTGSVVLEPLGLAGTVHVDSIFLEHTWPALQPFFEFDVTDGIFGGRFSYSVFLGEDGPHAVIDDANTLVENIEIKAGTQNETVLTVASVTTSGVRVEWPEARVRGTSIVVDGAVAYQWIRPDGTPSWDKLVPKETQEKVVEIYREVEEAFPWDIALDLFEVKNSTARVEDRTFPEPLQIVVKDANFTLADVSTGPGRTWPLAASATFTGDAVAKADGFVGTGPMGVNAEVGVENLDLSKLQPYLERIAPIELRSGRVAVSGSARAGGGGEGEPTASFTGDVTISEFDVGETLLGSTMLQWERVDTGGISATVGPMSLEIASIDVHDAGVEIVMSEDGKINVFEVMAAMSEAEGPEEGTAEQAEGEEEEEEGALPPLVVDTITLHGCSATVTDQGLTPAFSLAVDPVDGTITGLTTTKVVGAKLDLEGSVKTGGTVTVEGEMDLLDPKRLTDLAITVRQTDLPPMSPMSVKFVGHPIDEGAVNLGFDYEIVSSELAGANKIVTTDLAFGDKVEGEGKIKLPVKLGVSLLTDKNGQITLEFPIEGNLDDPGFLIASALGSAASEMVGELIKSPFRLLGKLGGGSGDEDLGFVAFSSGSAELDQAATDRLTILASGAAQRPALVLLVEGAWDAEADALGLKEAAFESRMAEVEASREVYESMYLEIASSDSLDALRAENMTNDETTGEQVLDETSYYRSLREAMIEAQPVDQAAITALADARAEAIRSFLVDEQDIDPARVRIVDPVAVEESPDDGWVRCRLDVDAGS